jgi:hypothetical protein
MARSVETKRQLLRKARLLTQDRLQGQDRPYFGFIKEYNETTDTTLVDSHGGRRKIFNPQPHLGRTAWMRAAPEAGMGTLLITRSDSEEPEHMRYWNTDTQTRLNNFRSNVEHLVGGSGQLVSAEAFRPLGEGEIDFSSRGGCHFFMGNRPHIDMRAGIVMLTMDQDEAEFGSKAPLHIRRGYQNKESVIRDEERFGVVRRQDAGSYVDRFFPDDKGNRGEEADGFAKEHLIRLTNAQSSLPETLFDLRSGNAIDDEGVPYTLDDTSLNLRVRSEYFTPAGTSVLMQLDESGNFKIEHPAEATVGGNFILPAGTLKARIGLDFARDVGRNEQVTVGVDKIQDIGHDDSKVVGNLRTLTVHGEEVRILDLNSTETVGGNKTIVVSGNLSIVSGVNSKMNFNAASGAFETDVFTVSAKEIILEAPVVTVNGDLNVTGTIKANGPLMSNTAAVAPNLGNKDFSGTKGIAGILPPKKAITT